MLQITPNVTSIIGTANQVNADVPNGNVTLSTPQDIATASSPQFVRLGIGGAAFTNDAIAITGTPVTGGAAEYGIIENFTFNAAGTTSLAGYRTANTGPDAITTASGYGYWNSDIALGSSASITNQYGFYTDGLTSGQQNYGYYSNVSSNSNQYAFYGGGTAKSYFNGRVGIGTTIPDSLLTVSANTAASPAPAFGTTLHMVQADGTNNLFGVDAFGGGDAEMVFRRAKGTNASPTNLVTDDTIGGIGATGYYTSAYSTGRPTAILFQAAENWTSASNLGTYMTFLNTPKASGTRAEVGRWTAAANLKIAGTAERATTEGTNHLDIFNGTAPVGTLANGISLYATAGELRVMDASGNPTLLSPHDKNNNWIFDSYVGKGKNRKRLIVDMEKMMRFLNDHFGTDFIHELEVD